MLLLVLLLLLLHLRLLLLLLTGPLNGFSNGRADGALHLLASVVVREDVSRGHAVGRLAALILALGDVRPELLHRGAVLGHGTLLSVLGVVRALRRVSQQEEPLLLLPQKRLPLLRRLRLLLRLKLHTAGGSLHLHLLPLRRGLLLLLLVLLLGSLRRMDLLLVMRSCRRIHVRVKVVHVDERLLAARLVLHRGLSTRLPVHRRGVPALHLPSLLVHLRRRVP
mmetsp:Transcript_1639/g.7169  ORF Transcript_1639/g.7169 Transcript_1639/m.7169 type:complete len:223 (-) Transcript_1639:1119-1787(-)